MIIGPQDTLYEGGFFKARLTFPEQYPLLPPKMKFISEMWHPSIYQNGNVCISILHDPGDDQWGYEDASERWSPVHTVTSIIMSVISLLSSDPPNTDSPANVDAAKEVRENLPADNISHLRIGPLVFVPIVLEPDSDPDFNPVVYTPEGPDSKTGGHPKKRKRRSEVLAASSKPSLKRRKLPHNVSEGPNVLMKYFAVDDLGPDSDSDSELADESRKQAPLSSDREADPESSPPIVLKSFAALVKAKSKTPQSPNPTPPATKVAAMDDSVTESESEEDINSKNTPVTKLFPVNRKLDAESETESDSGDELSHLDHKPLRNTSVVSSSATESDTDEDLSGVSNVCKPTVLERMVMTNYGQQLQPRPGFPLAPEQQRHGPLVLDEGTKIQVPATINTYLRDYQREGVKFFWKQYQEDRGGLLGDDMGLQSSFPYNLAGKTIQVISFLSAIMRKNGVMTDKHRRRKHVSRLQDLKAWRERRELPPANSLWPTCLIIAPSTVVHNWERELYTWGYFEVGLYTGGRKEREPVLHDFKMGRLDVVVTSFDIARKDIELLDNLAWSCVFVDEIACGRRFGLTGTTIQNSYQEMWTILDWTNPGRLGTPRQWHRFVVKPLTAGQSAAATEEERAEARVVALILKHKLLPDFFLRRTKEIIRNQLPKKTDQVVFCPLSKAQTVAYKRILGMDAVQNLIHRESPCTCGSDRTSVIFLFSRVVPSFDQAKCSRKNCCHPFVAGDVFRYMSILIKLSNHLALILPGPNDSPEQTARNRALADIAFPDGNAPKYGAAIMQTRYCGKWATLEVLLREWAKDSSNKVLIFTKSVKLLEMLDFHLKTQGYGFVKLEGSTKQSDRMPLIDKFHKDPKVFIFLISTLAGGTGLNLTGANKVVIFDPNWNPAHDLQAMDRAFRFGQTRDVSVYRLLGAGSVEELIYARQIYKQQQMEIGYNASIQTRSGTASTSFFICQISSLAYGDLMRSGNADIESSPTKHRYFEGIQGDNTKKGELFGIENIFRLHEGQLTTKMAIEKANLAELDWALANMGGGRTRKANKSTVEMIEADVGASKEDTTLKGLGALLFDDEAPQISELNEGDAIQNVLNTIGIKYSHHNDEILLPSRIEEERTKKSLMARATLVLYGQKVAIQNKGRPDLKSNGRRYENTIRLDFSSLPKNKTTESGTPSQPSPNNEPRSESLNDDIKDMQPSTLYDLNQQALEETYSDGPLVNDVAPLTVLRSEYEANDNRVFVKEIDWLIAHGYKDFRRVKAIGFAQMTQLLESHDQEMAVMTTLSTLAATRQLLNETGVQELVYEDFYDRIVELVQNVVVPDQQNTVLTSETLLEFFRDLQESNTIVMYLRLVTASQIQAHVDEFEFFLFHPDTKEPMSVPDFCNRVMGLGKEADHVEIKALCDAFRWNVEVAYLGGQSKDEVNFVKIPESPYPGSKPVVLLYRPGHYDILLK
ncbi:hypothetical protein NP233_g2852 [Leucocoprinus birnbaumii]|uniref:ubiquitinyl hydrolase 1 n=1 Tax=Leucocoprinus birnbaumii TaxID=56174 RepID=A0AAD5YYE8_9AGAR|nr:hypothetical protein NP233_g2852 [Leucocoprinus birnbaumii]